MLLKMIKIGFSLIMAASLISCDSDSEKAANQFDYSGNYWSLVSYGWTSETMAQLLPETHYEIRFSKEVSEVTGTIDCNSFQSSYSSTENNLSIDYLAPTEMLCSYEINSSTEELQKYKDQNSFITLALSTIDHSEIEEDKFIIYSVGGAMLSYKFIVVD
tara:strand:+ start:25 stop:504 length:480 start_codon:yes stop_codon:yes gene_type:complete